MGNSEIEILLVEDSIHDAEMTIRALRKSNISNKIIHLKDGALALDFLFGRKEYENRDTSNKPRIILLDLKMPKINGLEVLKAVKENELTKTIPVVVLTSSKEGPDIDRAYELGVNSYIVKPVDFDGFMKAIGEVGLYWMLINQPPT
ncbi:MAG TPA: response regulator [Chitinophagales bacterium]|nr:response regulator [Chitinophagales bacterium]